MDNLTGKIVVKNALSSAWASSWIYPKSNTIKERNDAMALAICFNELKDPMFISKPSDIPGYKKSKLDSDIENAITAMF